MKLFLDQDVYAVTIRFLIDLGYDVVKAAELGLSRANDVDLLRTAQEQDRIFITRDKDFGGLVFVEGVGPGVIYLRILPSTVQAVHEELARVLRDYSEEELKKAFVVIEAGRHRFRKVS
jgi:predicted nuclease of predicted toxin-antitoxin system